jgi:excisionase family DNA binding protein
VNPPIAALHQPTEGALEGALRRIIREELQRALADLAQVEPRAHVSSTELQEALSISRGTLRKMMKDGLPFTRPGKFPRFCVADVEAWLATRSASPLARIGARE